MKFYQPYALSQVFAVGGVSLNPSLKWCDTLGIDNSTGGSASKGNEQPITISQNYIADSPYWEYHTYGEGVLQRVANRIDKQAKKLELIKPSILEIPDGLKLDNTAPSMLNTSEAIKKNKKWLDYCGSMPQVIENFLLSNKLLRQHDDFTDNEEAVHAMNVEARNSNGESLGKFSAQPAKTKIGGITFTLYVSFRLIYDYIHTFNQDLQSMYTALCINGNEIDGAMAFQQQLETQHTTHLPNQINGTVIIETRDCNPKNTSFAPAYINKSSYFCGQHPDKECSCIAGKLYKKCHSRLHLLTRDFYIQSVRFIQMDHLGPFVREKDDGGFIPFTTMEVCQHQLTSIKEAFKRQPDKPLPEWIDTEQDRLNRREVPEEVQNLISNDRQRAYNREGFTSRPDLNAIVFGGDTPSNNTFGNRLNQQCKLLKTHLANDSSTSYLKITPGISATAALKQSDAVKHNKSLGEDLSNLGSFFDMYVKTGRIRNSHPKASTNEAYLGSWFIGDKALRIKNDAHKPQKVAASLNSKSAPTMMKLFQMYFEVFNQDLILMYNCLKIQGIDITGLEAYRQKRECCHTTHTFSRDMNPRVIYYGSHHYNLSQLKCGRYPWKECTTCINKCVPRLHELNELRFEREIKLFMTIKAFTKMKNNTEEEVRRSLAEEFKEAFERVKSDGNDDINVPEWIMQQIENPTEITLPFFTCDVCKAKYIDEGEAIVCEAGCTSRRNKTV